MSDGSEPPLMPGPPLYPGGQAPALEILGRSHNGDYLIVNINGDEFKITEPWLTVARRSLDRGYPPRPGGHRLHPVQWDALFNAVNAPQPLWPPVPCRVCDTDASVLINGHPHCATCARLFAAREERE